MPGLGKKSIYFSCAVPRQVTETRHKTTNTDTAFIHYLKKNKYKKHAHNDGIDIIKTNK